MANGTVDSGSGQTTMDEANLRIINWYILDDEARPYVTESIIRKVKREIWHLQEGVLKGKYRTAHPKWGQDDVKKSVYETGLAMGKLRILTESNEGFDELIPEYAKADALLTNDSFNGMSYATELRRGFDQAKRDYPAIEEEINKRRARKAAAKNQSDGAEGQPSPSDPKASRSNHASATSKPLEYGPIRDKIKRTYDDMRAELGYGQDGKFNTTLRPEPFGSYEDVLYTFKQELEQYNAISEKSLGPVDKVDWKADINGAEKKIDKLNDIVNAYNVGTFYNLLDEIMDRHIIAMPNGRPILRGSKRRYASIIDAALNDVNQLELLYIDSISTAQKSDLNVYRKRLKEAWRNNDPVNFQRTARRSIGLGILPNW